MYKYTSDLELLDGPFEIDWLVDLIFPPNTINLLVGPGGIGKSWLSLDLAVAIQTGRRWLGQFILRQGKVIIIDEESGDLLLRVRYQKLLNHYGLKPPGVGFFVDQRINFSKMMINTADYKSFISALSVLKPDLLIFDSLTRFHNEPENENHRMAKVFDFVKQLMLDVNTTILLLHHTGKHTGMYRGASDIYNACSGSMLQMDENKRVEQVKSRWEEHIQPFSVGFEVDRKKNSFGIRYLDAPPKQELWDWLFTTLKKDTILKEDLVRIATDESNYICSKSSFERLTKAKVESGHLERVPQGRKVSFKLGPEELLRYKQSVGEATILGLPILGI